MTLQVDKTEKDNVQILGIEYVPVQKSNFQNLYNINEALEKGTVFPELYLPFKQERGAK